jgi:hypothetical protein
MVIGEIASNEIGGSAALDPQPPAYRALALSWSGR